jgi:membrane-bound metal-dependent hydrolase YbcI (DUF457 family)
MTTYEHAMLGVTGTLAAGLHRKYGWEIVALAGFVAVLPDWDGLSLLFGAAAFDRVHRTLGHNLLVCILLGAVVAALEYRYRLARRWKEYAGRRMSMFRSKEGSPEPSDFRSRELCIWVLTGALASLSHLAADLVFSGHQVLSDWGIRLFWPFSDRFWAYPMVSWGDPAVTVVFAGGMFAMVRWPSRLRTVAGLTLTFVFAYISIRGVLGG